MEKKENMQEKIRARATPEVNSSMSLISEYLELCKEVMTNRQNPSKVAEVFRICCDVLFGTLQFNFFSVVTITLLNQIG